MPFRDILYNISYANLILYGAVIPSLDGGGKGKGGKSSSVIDAQDPRNREMYLNLISNMK